jgi:hypothetical protein
MWSIPSAGYRHLPSWVEARRFGSQDGAGPDGWAVVSGPDGRGVLGAGYEVRWYRFAHFGGLRDVEFVLGFRDRSAALGFLRPFLGNGPALATLRVVLAAVAPVNLTYGLEEHEALDQLAGYLAARAVVVGVTVARLTKVLSATGVAAPGPQPAPKVPRPKPRPAPPPPQERRKPAPPEEDPLLVPLDILAQVQTLRRAARDGIPFCERCSKARSARRPPAPAGASR